MARKQNPINDIINTVGGWLGGRGPGTNPQVQAAMDATRAVGKVVDTATGGFGQALLSDAQRMAQTGSSTPSALYKTAAVNLGAAATGAAAAKVAGKVVSNVVESGVPARVANRLTGQQVVVVGTKSDPIVSKVVKGRPGSGLGDTVYYTSDRSVAPGKMLPTVPNVVKEPQTIFPELKNTPVRWGWDPSKSPSMTDLTKDVTEYSNRWTQAKLEPRELAGGGQTLEYRGMYTPEIAVGKVKKSNVRSEPVMPNWEVTPQQSNAINELFKGTGSPNNPVFRKGAVASTSPVKVVSTVSPVTPPRGTYEQYGPTKSLEQVQKELQKAIKRAGGKVPKKK